MYLFWVHVYSPRQNLNIPFRNCSVLISVPAFRIYYCTLSPMLMLTLTHVNADTRPY